MRCATYRRRIEVVYELLKCCQEAPLSANMLRRRTRLVHTKVLVLVELLLKAEFLSKSVSRGVAYYSCTRRGKEFLEAYERLQALTVSAGLYEFGVF